MCVSDEYRSIKTKELIERGTKPGVARNICDRFFSGHRWSDGKSLVPYGEWTTRRQDIDGPLCQEIVDTLRNNAKRYIGWLCAGIFGNRRDARRYAATIEKRLPGFVTTVKGTSVYVQRDVAVFEA